jgi:POT family proton-dependent oligopeptide transporter
MVLIMATLVNTSKFPNFLKLLFFVEMWERFSYYGMRALLVLYLTSQLGFEDKKAYSIYSLFAAIGYAGPSIAGIIADKLLGFKNMVLSGGVIMTLGSFALAFSINNQSLVYTGLALMAVGTGMFKGNVTNLLGACYTPNDPAREHGFTLFYVAINLGSFIASISCSFIAKYYGWEYGFGLAGLGMLFGILTFLKYSSVVAEYGNAPAREGNKKLSNFNYILGATLIGLFLAYPVSIMLTSSEYYTDIVKYAGLIILAIMLYIIANSENKQRNNLLALSIFIVFLMIFFALEMQLGSLINLFAERNVNKEILGFAIPAAISQAINPFSIIIFGSILGGYIRPSKKYAIITFGFGLLCMAICFYILWLGCLNADVTGSTNYLYLVLGISCMGFGEVCVAPFVHAQTTLLAPKHLRGFIMGILMLSLAYSNLAGNIIAKFMSVPTVGGSVDSLQSLAIYRDGFLQIANFNMLIVGLFALSTILIKKLSSD